jgi:hypothetical protein
MYPLQVLAGLAASSGYLKWATSDPLDASPRSKTRAIEVLAVLVALLLGVGAATAQETGCGPTK